MADRTMKLFAMFALFADAKARCDQTNNAEWSKRHEESAHKLAREFMPSGSGFDDGTKFEISKSGASEIVFRTSYHHMNEHGMYDGWTDHVVRVRASLIGHYDIFVGGRNRNDIKELISQSFQHALNQTIVESEDGFRRKPDEA